MTPKCVKKDCPKGVSTGHALQRISPKGEDFVGVCEDHATEFDVVLDPLAKIIQDNNEL